MNWRNIRMAKHMVIKVKLTFIGCNGSNHSTFYSYWATGAGLSNNCLLYTCVSM